MEFQNTQSKQMKWWQILIVGAILLIIGIGLIILSYNTITTYNEKNKTYVETTAQVVDYAYDSEGLQAIIVEYQVNSKSYRKTSNSYSNMPSSIGTTVSIKYNPNNPQDAIWTTDSTNIVLPIVAVVITLVGILAVIFSLKSKKKEDVITTNATEQSNGLYSNISMPNQQPVMPNTNEQPQTINQNQPVQQANPTGQTPTITQGQPQTTNINNNINQGGM